MSLTYDDLAEALGIERESARRLVIRKRWKRTKGNDGKARVEVPTDELPARITGLVTGERLGQKPGDVTGLDAKAQALDNTGETKIITPPVQGQNAGDRPGDVTVESVTAVLSRHIEGLETEIAELRSRAADRDLIAGQLEGLKAILEEMRRERDDVRQDRDAWRQQAERLAAPPPVERRSWWRRIAG